MVAWPDHRLHVLVNIHRRMGMAVRRGMLCREPLRLMARMVNTLLRQGVLVTVWMNLAAGHRLLLTTISSSIEIAAMFFWSCHCPGIIRWRTWANTRMIISGVIPVNLRTCHDRPVQCHPAAVRPFRVITIPCCHRALVVLGNLERAVRHHRDVYSRKHTMKTMLSIWLSSNPLSNHLLCSMQICRLCWAAQNRRLSNRCGHRRRTWIGRPHLIIWVIR